jgi:methyl-accepting chemotaxis protein
LSGRLKLEFEEILQNAGKVNKLDEAMADITREQSEGIKQINVVVTHLDKVTQSNAANAEELSFQSKLLDENLAS